MEQPFNWTVFWTAIAAFAASASALLSAIYTGISWKMIRASVQPNVIVYAHHDDSRSTIIEIVIANIGAGVATDIVFYPSKPIPSKAFGADLASAEVAASMDTGPLTTGIPLLAPGEKRVITWGQFGGLYKALGDEYITVTAKYYHGADKLESVSRLEVKSFEWTDASDSAETQAVRELKRIGDTSARQTRALETIAHYARNLESVESPTT